jgi:thiol-disulfide isomerase/thioredoxin/YHS domain-containing protein
LNVFAMRALSMRGKNWQLTTVFAAAVACSTMQARGQEAAQVPHGPVSGAAGGGIHWRPTLEAAAQEATQTGKLVLVHFSATWCGPCRKLESTVFQSPEFANALESRFVPVHLDADQFAALARQFGISSIPTDVILDPSGRPLDRLPCPPDALAYITKLNQVAERAGVGAQPAPSTEFVTRPIQPAAGPIGPGPSGSGYGAWGGMPPSGGQAAVQGAVGPTAAGTYGSISPYPPENGLAAQPGVSTPIGNPTANSAGPQIQISPPMTAQQPAAGQPLAQAAPAAAGAEFGLDGYCAVQLLEGKRWIRGDRRWGAIHRGVTFLFAGPEEQQRFLADPDRYAPVLNGHDPVQLLDYRQSLLGRREHGVYYQNRVYLFTSAETRDQFARNPDRYSYNTLQAQRIIPDVVRR